MTDEGTTFPSSTRLLLLGSAGASVAGVTLYVLVTLLFAPEPMHMYIIAAMYGLGGAGVATLTWAGRPRLGGLAFVALNFAAASTFMISEGPDSGHVGIFFIAITLAGLLLSPRAAVVVGVAASALVGGVHLATGLGWTASAADSAEAGLWAKQLAQLAVAGVLTALATEGLHSALGALDRTQLDHRAMVEGSPDGIVLVDKHDRIVAINPAGRALLGEDAVGQTAFHLRGAPSAEARPNIVTVDGPLGERLISVRGRAVDAGHQITLRDVTEHEAVRRRERELEARTIEARKLEALGRLAGGVAHDFNNLLTVILANVHLLRALDGDNAREDLIQPIGEAALAAARVTHQLLSFVQPFQGLARSVDLHEILAPMARLLERTLGKGIALKVDCEGPFWIRAVPADVEQVVANLMVNAADAMPVGGVIQVRVKAAGDYVSMAVSDTGTGIEPELLESVFSPFFTTKAEGRGTGLGLSVVQRVITEAGGHVEVDSILDKGTTFTVYWSGAEASADSGDTSHLSRGHGESVLFIDDDVEIRQGVKRILESSGYLATVGAGVADTEAFLATGVRVDILVTDVVLGTHEHGVQVAKLVRAQWPDIPVLFVSGYTAGVLRMQGVDPAQAVLAKPFSPNQLQIAIGQALARHPRHPRHPLEAHRSGASSDSSPVSVEADSR